MANLDLNISIPDSKVARSKQRFLAVRPNNTLVEGTEDLLFTDKEWIEEVIKQFLRKLDSKGKKRIAEQAIVDLTDMFEL